MIMDIIGNLFSIRASPFYDDHEYPLISTMQGRYFVMRTSDGELEFYAFLGGGGEGGERQARCDIESGFHRGKRA